MATAGTTSSGGSGRLVRLPIGYLWAAGGAGLLGLILSYALGFSAGVSRAEAQRAAELDQRRVDGGPASDPLLRDGPGLGAGQAGGAGSLAGGSISGGTDPDPRRGGGAGNAPPKDGRSGGSSQGNARAGERGEAAASAEPRQTGVYYFVVAHAPVEKSRTAMVEFLRAGGLDARVVRDNNGVLRKVIVLPGFPSKDGESASAIKQMKDRIREAGFKWAKQARENRDFGDAYLELYRP